MAFALLSISIPNQTPISRPLPYTFLNDPCPLTLTKSSIGYSSRPFVSLASSTTPSSSSSTSVVEDDADSTSVSSDSSTVEEIRGCKSCGREEVERGCNGEGRIQGGIATYPGLGWWPIKAYRPCPGFLASGGRYQRKGQTLDDL